MRKKNIHLLCIHAVNEGKLIVRVPDNKTSNLPTTDGIKHNIFDDSILCCQ